MSQGQKTGYMGVTKYTFACGPPSIEKQCYLILSDDEQAFTVTQGQTLSV